MLDNGIRVLDNFPLFIKDLDLKGRLDCFITALSSTHLSSLIYNDIEYTNIGMLAHSTNPDIDPINGFLVPNFSQNNAGTLSIRNFIVTPSNPHHIVDIFRSKQLDEVIEICEGGYIRHFPHEVTFPRCRTAKDGDGLDRNTLLQIIVIMLPQCASRSVIHCVDASRRTPRLPKFEVAGHGSKSEKIGITSRDHGGA